MRAFMHNNAQPQPFVLGVNYWPRRKAMYWWSDFDAGEVRDEFEVIQAYVCRLVDRPTRSRLCAFSLCVDVGALRQTNTCTLCLARGNSARSGWKSHQEPAILQA